MGQTWWSCSWPKEGVKVGKDDFRSGELVTILCNFYPSVRGNGHVLILLGNLYQGNEFGGVKDAEISAVLVGGRVALVKWTVPGRWMARREGSAERPLSTVITTLPAAKALLIFAVMRQNGRLPNMRKWHNGCERHSKYFTSPTKFIKQNYVTGWLIKSFVLAIYEDLAWMFCQFDLVYSHFVMVYFVEHCVW